MIDHTHRCSIIIIYARSSSYEIFSAGGLLRHASYACDESLNGYCYHGSCMMQCNYLYVYCMWSFVSQSATVQQVQ